MRASCRSAADGAIRRMWEFGRHGRRNERCDRKSKGSRNEVQSAHMSKRQMKRELRTMDRRLGQKPASDKPELSLSIRSSQEWPQRGQSAATRRSKFVPNRNEASTEAFWRGHMQRHLPLRPSAGFHDRSPAREGYHKAKGAKDSPVEHLLLLLCADALVLEQQVQEWRLLIGTGGIGDCVCRCRT